MALEAISEIMIAIGRTALEFYLFTPHRRGKLRDKLSRAERIERIYDWRESAGRPHRRT